MEADEFVWEPSSQPFIFAPPFFISLVMVLVCSWILSPFLGERIVPKFKTFKPIDKSVFSTIPASTIHAIVTLSLSTYILINGLMGSNRLFSKSPLGFVNMQISLGYFIGDFIVVLFDPHLRKDFSYTAHHMAGIIGLSLGLYHQGKFMFFIVYRMLAEASTPFLNAFYLFRMTDSKENYLYRFVSWSMLITFFVFRIVVIPWHWYELLSAVLHPAAPQIIPIFFRFWLGTNYLAFDVLNIFWLRKMVRGAIKHLTSTSKEKL